MQKLMFTPVNVSNYFWTQRTDTPCLVPSSFYDEQTLESLPWISSLPSNLKEDFQNITKEMALKHPKWEMGQKISIDSATMINK